MSYFFKNKIGFPFVLFTIYIYIYETNMHNMFFFFKYA